MRSDGLAMRLSVAARAQALVFRNSAFDHLDLSGRAWYFVQLLRETTLIFSVIEMV
jgi:hypothetical protein